MTDINKNKIIFRLLPLGLHKYINLFRLDRPIGFMLLFYPVSFGLTVSTKFNLDFIKLLFIFFLGSIIMRSAGCIINDIWDRKIDSQISRTNTRPIASGEIKLAEALIILLILLLVGLFIIVNLNILTIFLSIIILPAVILYPLAKRYFFMPQLILGLIYNWGVIIGWSSTHLNVSFVGITILYISCIVWTLIYDTVYATLDEQEDIKFKIYSTAILFGKNKQFFLNILIFIQFIILNLVGKYFNYNYEYFILITMIGITMALDLNLIWRNSVINSLSFFKRNNIYGFLILIALLIGSNF
ncbi:4-hydroxybenzoate octaprenyltransferase [Alphaproteobacteria bacterium]|nr:4-hydroxybenzoate octaprenyltransferase [Alphaproteobacteria bacterium]